MSNENGISPAMGVIVMVVITVSIAIIIGTVALDLGGSTEESVQAGVDIQQQGNGYYRIQWETAGTAEELQVLVNGSELDNATLSSPGDSVTVSVGEGDTISVTGSSGDSTSQLSSTTAESGSASSPTVSSTPETTLSNSTSSDTSGSGETVTVDYSVTNESDTEKDMNVTLDVSDGVGQVDSTTEAAVSPGETREGTLEWEVSEDQENGDYTLTTSGGGETSETTVTIQEPINSEIKLSDSNVTDNTVELSVSTSSAANVQSVEWSLGDGTTKSGETVSHTYDSNGTYDVSVTLTTDSKTTTKTKTIPVNPDCTVIDSNKTLSAGTHEYNCLEVTSGTTVTMEGDPSSDGPDSYGGVKIKSVGDIIVDGTLHAEEQGYSTTSGPGAGTGGGGGGYGGVGGGNDGGGTYGDIMEANRLGSGGYKEEGGGAVWLKSESGEISINGSINASGGDPKHVDEDYSGGGSGGSIRIEAPTVSGTGSLNASGGTAHWEYEAGGGGGRILVDGTNNYNFSTDVTRGGGDYKGNDGTINRTPAINGITTETATGNVGYDTEFVPQVNDPDGDKLAYKWDFGDGTTSTDNRGLHSYSEPGTYTVTVTVKDEHGLSDSYSREYTVEETGSCTVYDSDDTIPARTYDYRCVEVQSGTTLTMAGDTEKDSNGKYGGVHIKSAGDLIVKGDLYAEEQGYDNHKGPGGGDDGGGYGGVGGGSDGGSTYGSANSATRLGSGGDREEGGGAVWLESESSVTIDGTINASGGDPKERDDQYNGGGSGGSIRVEAPVVSGSGRLDASGGTAYWEYEAGGGGGRILIDGTNNYNFDLDVSRGGGDYKGNDGTIVQRPVIDKIDTSTATGSDGYDTLFIPEFTEPDGDDVSYKWDFGDGSTSTDKDPAHTFDQTGTYTVQVTITDEHGLDETHSIEYTVEENGPCTVYDSNDTLPAGEYNFRCFEVTDGTTLTLGGDPASDGPDSYGGVKVKTGGDLLVNGTLDGEEQGYSTGSGPGGSNSYGAGYGGVGGGFPGGSTYGADDSATRLGSGGKREEGGGAVWLESTGGVVDISGTINVSGGDPKHVDEDYTGGGSGGAIRIEAPSITGDGHLNASGGTAYWEYEAGGGGGRIYMNGTNNHSISTDVTRGGGDYKGNNGTVVQEDNYSG